MNQTSKPKRTALYPKFVELGARIIPFAGWEMPVWFSSLKEEHNAVRNSVGLFDVSHMGEIEMSGPDAFINLQYLTINNVAKLEVGKAQYSGMCYPNGGYVDDLLVYMITEEQYLLCVNASNNDKDFEWIRNNVKGNVEVMDAGFHYTQLALQGPKAVDVITRVAPPDVAELKPFRYLITDKLGTPTIISRTGYTGEDGFELYFGPSYSLQIWEALMDAGKPEGILPVGLGARDTLRLEAALPLYGNDIDDTTTPIEAGLGWVAKIKKGDFIGREVIAKHKIEGFERKLVGFEVTGGIPRKDYPIVYDGKQVGIVTSGTRSPWSNRNIGLGYVPLGLSEIGSQFDVVIRNKPVQAKVVPTPFHKPNID